MGNVCETYFESITGHHHRLDEFMAACNKDNSGLPKEFDATDLYGDSYCRRISLNAVELMITTSWTSPDDEIEAMIKAWPWLEFIGHNTVEEYGNTDSWDNSEEVEPDPYDIDGDPDAEEEIEDKSDQVGPAVADIFKARGVNAIWHGNRYLDVMPGNGYHWNFDTADGEMWGSRLLDKNELIVFGKDTDYSAACENAEALADSIQRVMADPVAAANMIEVNENAYEELLGLCRWIMAKIDEAGETEVKLLALRTRAQATFNQWENV